MSKRILIADDETHQHDLRSLLTNHGYLVIGDTSDGLIAINMARRLKPDLIIIDGAIEDIDGTAAARILAQEKIAPVMLLTNAEHTTQDIALARETGIASCLVKPLRETTIMPAIEVTLAHYEKFRVLEKQVDQLSEQLETRKTIERAKGLLMRKQQLSEPEAFRKIQRLSMSSRKTMREIAEAILLTDDLGV